MPYDPNQPRAPRGSSIGGQWITAGKSARLSAGLLPEPGDVFRPDGEGTIPSQQDTYFGLDREMTPTEFLAVCPERRQDSTLWIGQEMRAGRVFANPVLFVSWDPATETWQTTGHEGRNRMIVYRSLFGDLPVPVRLIFGRTQEGREMRSKDVTPRMLSAPIQPDERRNRIYEAFGVSPPARELTAFEQELVDLARSR